MEQISALRDRKPDVMEEIFPDVLIDDPLIRAALIEFNKRFSKKPGKKRDKIDRRIKTLEARMTPVQLVQYRALLPLLESASLEKPVYPADRHLLKRAIADERQWSNMPEGQAKDAFYSQTIIPTEFRLIEMGLMKDYSNAVNPRYT